MSVLWQYGQHSVSPPWSRLAQHLALLTSLLGLLNGVPRRLQAQDSAAVPAGGWHIRAIHVLPHLIVLDPTTRSATLEFSNTGNVTTDADVLVQLGYTYFPGRDTTLFPPHWTSEQQTPRDTVIASPGVQDHYLAGC